MTTRHRQRPTGTPRGPDQPRPGHRRQDGSSTFPGLHPAPVAAPARPDSPAASSTDAMELSGRHPPALCRLPTPPDSTGRDPHSRGPSSQPPTSARSTPDGDWAPMGRAPADTRSGAGQHAGARP